MKFMVTWKIPPGCHKPAAEAFVKAGAPAPAGMEILGRWHAPGSADGWALIQGNDMKAIAQHMAEWANLLELRVTPVIEDKDAGESLARVYGGQA